jgi:eukaryotic-like serine/threonine-protein kinase
MLKLVVSRVRAAFGSTAQKGGEWGLCDDYEVLHTLGKGSSARVFQGVNVLSGKPVVIKLFKKIAPEAVKKEIEINCGLLRGLESLKPEQQEKVRFIELLDSLYDPACAHFTLIYQFYPGVPLNELISSIAQPQAIKTVLSLAHTLRFVHGEGLMHRDIKPANVLVTPSGARLFDFGLAKPVG